MSSDSPKRREDFDIGALIGESAIGPIRVVTDREDGSRYAMKILSKHQLLRGKNLQATHMERLTLSKCRHPNVIRFVLSFQDPTNLYHILELAPNGTLQQSLDGLGCVSSESAKFVAGQLLLAIAHLHQNRILHRDLAPDNVLLGDKWRVKLADFGSAVIVADGPLEIPNDGFCRNPDYAPPEAFGNGAVGHAGDLWTFGCLIFALLAGASPFHSNSVHETIERIRGSKFEFPDGFPDDARDLVKKLLVVDPGARLASGDFAGNYPVIRAQAFFTGIDWGALPEQPGRELVRGVSVATERPHVRPPPRAGSTFLPQGIPLPVATAPAPAAAAKSRAAYIVSQVPKLLRESEHSLLEGLIVKKRNLSVKERLLVLTDRPRLFYVDLKSKLVMGDVEVSKALKVVVLKGANWNIEVPGRVYNLTSKGDVQPNDWAVAIGKVVQSLP
jgi:3-phosphoinositide dependent protein kinase-1